MTEFGDAHEQLSAESDAGGKAAAVLEGRVNHRRPNVAVAKEFTRGSDIV